MDTLQGLEIRTLLIIRLLNEAVLVDIAFFIMLLLNEFYAYVSLRLFKLAGTATIIC